MVEKVDASELAHSNGQPYHLVFVRPNAQPAAPVIDVSDDPGVIARMGEFKQAEAEHIRLSNRLAIDGTITPAQMRAAEDAVSFARTRVESATRHAIAGRKALVREQLTQLHQRARKLVGNAPARIREAQRLHMAHDEACRGVGQDNAEAHAIGQDGERLRASALALGIDLDALALEVEIGGLEFSTSRLLGGSKVGEFEVAKHMQPCIVGGYDPGLVARVAAPPPPPGPAPLVCHVFNEAGQLEQSFAKHIVTYVDYIPFNPQLTNHYMCERCRKAWPKAEYEAMWGIKQQTLHSAEPMGWSR